MHHAFFVAFQRSIHFETVLSSMNNSDFCLFTGDVPPISMSPISQSQFIPLGEVLLLAISAMNSAHKSVTQETLTEHLQTCFPGNTNYTTTPFIIINITIIKLLYFLYTENIFEFAVFTLPYVFFRLFGHAINPLRYQQL